MALIKPKKIRLLITSNQKPLHSYLLLLIIGIILYFFFIYYVDKVRPFSINFKILVRRVGRYSENSLHCAFFASVLVIYMAFFMKCLFLSLHCQIMVSCVSSRIHFIILWSVCFCRYTAKLWCLGFRVVSISLLLFSFVTWYLCNVVNATSLWAILSRNTYVMLWMLRPFENFCHVILM